MHESALGTLPSADISLSSAALPLQSAASWSEPTSVPKDSVDAFSQPPGHGHSPSSFSGDAVKMTMTRLLNGKEEEWTAVAEKPGPLNLLDLPLDVLREIVKEVTHTNDLTSLALCHSALHDLAIPHIYSRFDIVWPDATTNVEPRSGVDALTYGLATLVFGEEIFGEAPNQQKSQAPAACANCGHCPSDARPEPSDSQLLPRARKRRRGNHYAEFTRKFSLGNGPADWVQEYLISKEGGKMLGTLVAVAIARMRNLETFVWDMPTGVLRDVWMALASLGDRHDPDDCKLERIWIRWHDNFQLEGPSSISAMPALPNGGLPPPNVTHLSGTGQNSLQPSSNSHHPIGSVFDRVENPTFSVLPPLKSLSVLDIDELLYLEEMSVLIGKSKKKLRELRVGIARHAQDRHWTALWDGESTQQATVPGNNLSSAMTSEKRLGGVLGILVNKFYDVRQGTSQRVPMPQPEPLSTDISVPVTPPHDSAGVLQAQQAAAVRTNTDLQEEVTAPSPSNSSSYATASQNSSPEKSTVPHFVEDLPPSIATTNYELPDIAALSIESTSLDDQNVVEPPKTPTTKAVHWLSNAQESIRKTKFSLNPFTSTSDDGQEDVQLALEVLELERVPLSVTVLQQALDWSKLTDLTILDCQNYDQLWKALRRSFAPIEDLCRTKPASKDSKAMRTPTPQYRLKIRKLHTNVVSSSLMAFLKETLAPNTLEILFLQDSRANPSSVSIDALFRGPLRRHRASLRKLSIDASEKAPDGHPIVNSRWRKWLLNRDILGFICGGRMSNLRELGMAIEYRDWHFFLQRLPQIPHLRSLYIPFIADHAHGNNIDSRELALQIVDIVTLRPDIELCYMGIGTKCFEILELNAARPDHHRHNTGSSSGSAGSAHGGYSDDEEDEDEDEDGDDDDARDDHDGDDGDDDDDDDDPDDAANGALPALQRPATRLKLREILFYDDKVAIFKARHGRL